jgi:sec-independent protein translocase protein TatB
MLDFSFSEIGLVAIVALLALGPERLPKAARTAGVMARRARASWQNLRDEIEREFAADDLTRAVNVAKQADADLRRELETSPSSEKSSAPDVAGVAKSHDAANILVADEIADPTEINGVRLRNANHDER